MGQGDTSPLSNFYCSHAHLAASTTSKKRRRVNASRRPEACDNLTHRSFPQAYKGKNVHSDVLHDHDADGNSIHGTLEELHADGKDAVDIVDMPHLEKLFEEKVS